LLVAIPGVVAAQAPAAGEDEVTLKNGGMLRGTVVSVDPNHEVSIIVQGTREARRIPWAEVDRVNRGKFRAQDTPPPPPPPAPPAPPPPGAYAPPGAYYPAGPVGPRVHIQSDAPDLQLHEIISQSSGMVWGAGWGAGWGSYTTSRPVCSVPCDRVIDASAGQSFFVRGPGVPASAPFVLAARGPVVNLDVKAGSTALRAGGIAVTSIGGAAILVGLIVLAVGSVSIDGPPDQTAQIAGGITTGFGVAALVGGIVMIVQAKTTASFVGLGHEARSPLAFTF
jgi:hypothetical protein